MSSEWGYPPEGVHLARVAGYDVRGMVFAPLSFKATYDRLPISAQAPIGEEALGETLQSLCDVAGTDADAGWFAVVRGDAQRFGTGVSTFLKEVVAEHPPWSDDDYARGVGAWLAPATAAAPGVRAVVFTGRPEQSSTYVGDGVFTIVASNGHRFDAYTESLPGKPLPVENWRPDWLTVKPAHSDPVTPVDELVVDEDRAEVLVPNPFESAADVVVLRNSATDAARERAVDCLCALERLRGHGPPGGHEYVVDKVVLTSLSDLGTGDQPIWNASVSVSPS